MSTKGKRKKEKPRNHWVTKENPMNKGEGANKDPIKEIFFKR
jgi:hypothetical protein